MEKNEGKVTSTDASNEDQSIEPQKNIAKGTTIKRKSKDSDNDSDSNSEKKRKTHHPEEAKEESTSSLTSTPGPLTRSQTRKLREAAVKSTNKIQASIDTPSTSSIQTSTDTSKSAGSAVDLTFTRKRKSEGDISDVLKKIKKEKIEEDTSLRTDTPDPSTDVVIKIKKEEHMKTNIKVEKAETNDSEAPINTSSEEDLPEDITHKPEVVDLTEDDEDKFKNKENSEEGENSTEDATATKDEREQQTSSDYKDLEEEENSTEDTTSPESEQQHRLQTDNRDSEEGDTTETKSKSEDSRTSIESATNRHTMFFQSLLPTLNEFTDEEIQYFQSQVRDLIQNIRSGAGMSTSGTTLSLNPPTYVPPGLLSRESQIPKVRNEEPSSSEEKCNVKPPFRFYGSTDE